MVAEVRGVKVDQEQFPMTYQVRGYIIKMANAFKQPAEDALQDCMMQEHIYKTQGKVPNKGCIAVMARNSMLNHHKRHTLRFQYKDIHEGTFIKYTRKDLYTKMFMEEVAEILNQDSTIKCQILKIKVKYPDMTWTEVYREYFSTERSRGWFWRQVNHIRGVCREIAERNCDLLENIRLGSIRVSPKGIIEDIGVLAENNT